MTTNVAFALDEVVEVEVVVMEWLDGDVGGGGWQREEERWIQKSSVSCMVCSISFWSVTLISYGCAEEEEECKEGGMRKASAARLMVEEDGKRALGRQRTVV